MAAADVDADAEDEEDAVGPAATTITTTSRLPAAASASERAAVGLGASAGSATAGEQQRALHEEIARLHRSLGLAAQEAEVLREEVRAKEVRFCFCPVVVARWWSSSPPFVGVVDD